MVAETGHHNEQYLRSLVLDDSALAAMTKEREELAARADIASNLDNLMHGPLASNLMSAFETVRNAIADRHGPAWQRELRENAVSDDVWLAHLYQLLDDLHKQTEVRMARCGVFTTSALTCVLCVWPGRHARGRLRPDRYGECARAKHGGLQPAWYPHCGGRWKPVPA